MELQLSVHIAALNRSMTAAVLSQYGKPRSGRDDHAAKELLSCTLQKASLLLENASAMLPGPHEARRKSHLLPTAIQNMGVMAVISQQQQSFLVSREP